MSVYNPCIACEYNNKPYWSVVSPCQSCQKVYNPGTGGYVVTTTTDAKVEKFNDTHILPTSEEYREAAQKVVFQFDNEWSEPKYQCPKCGGGMCRNERVALASLPAQYMYRCNKCGNVDYQYM